MDADLRKIIQLMDGLEYYEEMELAQYVWMSLNESQRKEFFKMDGERVTTRKPCDCESEICERKGAHNAAACGNGADIRIAIYGEQQNVCFNCNETAKGFFTAHEDSYKVIGDPK